MAIAKLDLSKKEILAIASARKTLSISPQALVTSALRMKACNLKNFLKINADMSNAEKNAALDDAIGKWVRCLARH